MTGGGDATQIVTGATSLPLVSATMWQHVTVSLLWFALSAQWMTVVPITVPCEVRVFPMIVKRQFNTWPEAHERVARWFEPAKALSVIKDKGLRDLIESFFASKSRRRPK